MLHDIFEVLIDVGGSLRYFFKRDQAHVNLLSDPSHTFKYAMW